MTFINLIPDDLYNVKQYGAKGDGSTDDTSAIASAISAASSAGGGIIFFPAGTYISTTQTLVSNVILQGAGIGATTLKLKNGANADLLSAQTGSINLSAAINTGSVGTLLSFAIRDLTLDGNKANQTAGPSYPLRFYGYNFTLRDLQIMNGYSGGALIDWNGGSSLTSPSDNMESLIDNCKLHDNSGIGLQMGGPHDSKLRDVICFSDSSHNFHFAPNTAGLLATNCHGYLNSSAANTCCYLVESGVSFTNCVAEGSYYCDVAMIANGCSWIGGVVFGTSAEWTSEVGIQLGQIASQTPFTGMIQQSGGTTTAVEATACTIYTSIQECHGGLIKAGNESSNTVFVNGYLTGGSVFAGGIELDAGTDTFCIQVGGSLTIDGTRNTTNSFNIASRSSSYPFTVTDATNGQTFQIDQYGNMYLNGGFNTAAGLYFTASTTAGSLASNGTINIQGLPNIVVAPTGNVTGIILQAGFAGQFALVVNASAFTVTMAAQATSHVSNGTGCVIAANSGKLFFYDGTNSLWYPC